METKKTLKEMVSKINQVWREKFGYFATVKIDESSKVISITNRYFTGSFTEWLVNYLEESGYKGCVFYYSANKEYKVELRLNF